MDTQELQKLKNKFDIIGNDPGLNRALEMAVKFASTDLTVLITGESGTGKENISRIIHQYSDRRGAKFFALNCGAVAQGTIDSELFGHVKGAYTGASETRPGYFEEYNGGTIFLDEIAEMPLSSQAKLLRVLQSGEYVKVGSTKVEHTNVRVIAATNISLEEAVRRGKFREDLYYRIAVATIRLPALRERKDDIYLLFRKFASDYSEKNEVTKVSLTHDAIDMLRRYSWPGNIRQLMNVTYKICALEAEEITPNCTKTILEGDKLKEYIPREEKGIILFNGEEIAKGTSTFTEEEKQALYRAILDLKTQVEQLRAMVVNGTPPSRQIAANDVEDQWQPGEEPEEQEQQGGETQEKENISLKDSELDMIRRSLERHGGNRKAAAQELGISERTLYRKLNILDKNKK